MRSHALAWILTGVALLAAACGSSDAGSDARAADGPTTKLTITATQDEDSEPVVLELTCDPAGGDHPQPSEACDALAAAGADVFEPVPTDRACTMIYGGPQTVTLVGTYQGSPVDATFDRSNGCEIDRWEKLGTTVFTLPLQ